MAAGGGKYIPADLHEQILHHLPSHTLLNFKRVCKHWNQLISSQKFIQEHRSTATLIAMLSPSAVSVSDDPIRWSVPYPNGFSVNTARIAGSCNGLVCLVQEETRNFAIINPSTGESSVRETEGFVFNPKQCVWFGRHPSTGEYLIAAMEVLTGRIRVDQITRRRLATEFPITQAFHPFDTVPILLQGGLHWPGFLGTQDNMTVFVLAYDIEKNRVLVTLAPFESPFDVRLGAVDGCLFAIIQTWRERRFEVWIMEEYGVRESWAKYGNIEGFEGCRVPFPLGFLADGDLLLNVGTKMVVKYSFGDKKGRIVDVYRDDCDYIAASSAILCGDSFVSPWEVSGDSFVSPCEVILHYP